MDTPLFDSGRAYTRQQIYTILGGDVVSNFPQQQGRVIYCCLNQESHRKAPEMILIRGQGRQLESARNFATQHEAVPVFVKHKGTQFRYQGLFVVERYSEDRAEILLLSRQSYSVGIGGALFLRRVDE